MATCACTRNTEVSAEVVPVILYSTACLKPETKVCTKLYVKMKVELEIPCLCSVKL